jgi:hypothetical protein
MWISVMYLSLSPLYSVCVTVIVVVVCCSHINTNVTTNNTDTLLLLQQQQHNNINSESNPMSNEYWREFSSMLSRLPQHNVEPFHQIPDPRVGRLHVLFVILSFDFSQFNEFLQTLVGATEMCNFGWSIKIVIHTSKQYNESIWQRIYNRTYCKLERRRANVTAVVFPARLASRLAVPHRKLFEREMNNFDLFIYTEEDISVRFHHCLLYLWELSHLHGKYVPGFQRWIYFENERWAETQEEPRDGHVRVIHLSGQWYHRPYPHQAMAIYTRNQLRHITSIAKKSCYFFKPEKVLRRGYLYREIMSSLQFFVRCGFIKVIPIFNYTYFGMFTVQHGLNLHVKSGTPHASLLRIFNATATCAARAVTRNLSQYDCPYDLQNE